MRGLKLGGGMLKQKGIKPGLGVFICIVLLCIKIALFHTPNAMMYDSSNRLSFCFACQSD